MKKSLVLLCLIGVSSIDAKVPNHVHLQLKSKGDKKSKNVEAEPTNNENIEQ